MERNDKRAKNKSIDTLRLSKIKLKSANEVSNLDESIINTVWEPLLVFDKKLRLIETNRSSYDGKYDRRKIP